MSPVTAAGVTALPGYEDVPSLFFARPAAGHVVALTFDPSDPQNIEAILDILQEHDVKATFFAISDSVALAPATWQRVAADGHPIGNHSVDHPDLTTLPYAEVLYQITESRRQIEELTGAATVPYVRPPYGYFNRAVLRAAGDAGYVAVVNWDIDTIDWRDGTDLVLERGIRGTDGSIVLMHDQQSTVEALPQIIASYRERGFRFVTVPELLDGASLTGGNAQYRVMNLRSVDGAKPKLDVFVQSRETESLVRGGLVYGYSTGYVAPPQPGVFRIARVRARPQVCTERTCGLITSPGVDAGALRATILVHSGGFLKLVEAGPSPPSASTTVVLSAASATKANVYVVAAALRRNADGLRLHRRGQRGCLASANAPGALIGGTQVNNFRLPPGTSYLTLHSPADTSCSAAPLGGPFAVVAAAGSRKYLLLHGAPGAMRAKVVAIPAP